MDEKLAVTRLKHGDPGGLEVLVHLYQVQAIRAACLIVGDRLLAEDIVQNAFLRASERIDQFDARRPFGPWFLRSVVNDSIKAAQRQKRQVPLEDESGEPLDVMDVAPLPEELAEAEETRQAIWLALGKLSPDQRAAIVMRYYLDMSEESMTEELNSPVGTIKWRLYAARQRLQKSLFSFRPSKSSLVTKAEYHSTDEE